MLGSEEKLAKQLMKAADLDGKYKYKCKYKYKHKFKYNYKYKYKYKYSYKYRYKYTQLAHESGTRADEHDASLIAQVL